MSKKNKSFQQIIKMPSPAFYSKLQIEEPESSDQTYEFVQSEITDKLLEEIGQKLDDYFELTGEPITAAITFVHHTIDAVETISGRAKNGNVKTIIIAPSSKQLLDEDEDEFFSF